MGPPVERLTRKNQYYAKKRASVGPMVERQKRKKQEKTRHNALNNARVRKESWTWKADVRPLVERQKRKNQYAEVVWKQVP